MKRSPTVYLSLGFALLLAIVALVATFTIEMERNAAEQANLFRASARIGLLFSALQDAEIGQRGFLIARDERYLKPYHDAVDNLPDRVKGVEDALAGRPDQQQDFSAIKALIPQKLANLKEGLDLATAGNNAEVAAQIKEGLGVAVMDQIRVIVARMRDRQAAALADAGAAVQSASTRLLIGVVAAAALAILLAWLAFAEKRRQRLIVERHALDLEGHSRVLELTNQKLTSEIESRRAAEDQMRQMQKIEAIGQLTGGLAHDFNNMLAVILSALGLAERRLKSGDTQITKYLEAASEAGNRAANLTKRLLAFARQQPLAPETVDVNKMVSDMSELLRRTLGEAIQLETVLAGGLWRIHVDANQLENSIINLAVNARDAMPDGGRITIETSNSHLDEEYASQNPGTAAGQYVLVAVTDTGVGMSPEVVAKAFDPFFTTKGVGKGTGLGLSQVYGFVKQSNGHIKIYSEVGQGTAVKLYLPRYFAGDATKTRTGEAKAKLPVGKPSEVILLVEDEDRVRALSHDALREIGYQVIVAESAKMALELLPRHPETVLLFTDIVMPEMSGRALAEAALNMRPDLKVLYTTGFTRNAVVHNGILDPGVNFLAKPFTIEQLAAKVRAAIDG